MNMRNILDFRVVMIGVMLLGWFHIPMGAVQAADIIISEVLADPQRVNFSKGETSQISFNLNQAATIQVLILDADGWPIKHLVENTALPAGRNSITWNGKDDQNTIVPDEAYAIYIHAENETGIGDYSPFNVSGIQKGLYPEIEKTQLPIRVTFTTYEPLRIQVRIGIDNGPLLHTITDFKPMWTGTHVLTWDGRDETGEPVVSDLEKVKVLASAFTLPDLFIMSYGSSIEYCDYKFNKAQTSGNWNEILELSEVMQNRPQPINFHPHADRTRVTDRVPTFSFVPLVRQSQNKSAKDLQVTVSLDEISSYVLTQNRFEIKLYVNNELITEEEQGYAPYSFSVPWNEKWSEKILVTVNLATMRDQIGSGSRFVSVSP